jgi:hypothetical protein
VLKLKIINGGEGEPLLQSFTILLTGCIQRHYPHPLPY